MSKAGKFLIIAVLISAIIFLFKIKAIAPASILSFILFTASLAERILRIQAAKKMNDAFKGAAPKNNAGMTEEEALDILGLDKGASEKEIKQAYKKLMQKIHPDAGGNKHLAAQVNKARDVMLNKVKGK